MAGRSFQNSIAAFDAFDKPFDAFDNSFDVFDNSFAVFDKPFDAFDNSFDVFDKSFDTFDNSFGTCSINHLMHSIIHWPRLLTPIVGVNNRHKSAIDTDSVSTIATNRLLTPTNDSFHLSSAEMRRRGTHASLDFLCDGSALIRPRANSDCLFLLARAAY